MQDQLNSTYKASSGPHLSYPILKAAEGSRLRSLAFLPALFVTSVIEPFLTLGVSGFNAAHNLARFRFSDALRDVDGAFWYSLAKVSIGFTNMTSPLDGAKGALNSYPECMQPAYAREAARKPKYQIDAAAERAKEKLQDDIAAIRPHLSKEQNRELNSFVRPADRYARAVELTRANAEELKKLADPKAIQEAINKIQQEVVDSITGQDPNSSIVDSKKCRLFNEQLKDVNSKKTLAEKFTTALQYVRDNVINQHAELQDLKRDLRSLRLSQANLIAELAGVGNQLNAKADYEVLNAFITTHLVPALLAKGEELPKNLDEGLAYLFGKAQAKAIAEAELKGSQGEDVAKLKADYLKASQTNADLQLELKKKNKLFDERQVTLISQANDIAKLEADIRDRDQQIEKLNEIINAAPEVKEKVISGQNVLLQKQVNKFTDQLTETKEKLEITKQLLDKTVTELCDTTTNLQANQLVINGLKTDLDLLNQTNANLEQEAFNKTEENKRLQQRLEEKEEAEDALTLEVTTLKQVVSQNENFLALEKDEHLKLQNAHTKLQEQEATSRQTSESQALRLDLLEQKALEQIKRASQLEDKNKEYAQRITDLEEQLKTQVEAQKLAAEEHTKEAIALKTKFTSLLVHQTESMKAVRGVSEMLQNVKGKDDKKPTANELHSAALKKIIEIASAQPSTLSDIHSNSSTDGEENSQITIREVVEDKNEEIVKKLKEEKEKEIEEIKQKDKDDDIHSSDDEEAPKTPPKNEGLDTPEDAFKEEFVVIDRDNSKPVVKTPFEQVGDIINSLELSKSKLFYYLPAENNADLRQLHSQLDVDSLAHKSLTLLFDSFGKKKPNSKKTITLDQYNVVKDAIEKSKIVTQ